jgi:NADPH-dependent curcumin reductase CurA
LLGKKWKSPEASSGQLKVQEDIIGGLENTPKALIGLLAGENRGKRMIKL